MTLDERRRVYAEAIAVYGEEAQLKKVTEELGELITEVSRIGTPREEQLQVLDELADVYVMLEQLAMIASISDRSLDDRITYKVGRLCGKLAEGGR